MPGEKRMGSLQEISGAKSSGSSQKAATETPDSLISIAYAKVLDAISEGPIAGLANGNQSIFLNNTPLANADGSLNFTGVTVGTRTGEADQDYLPGFPSVESETGVGVELKFSAPWVQTISNTELSAVRVRLSVPYLAYTDDKGNINGFQVAYAIDIATDTGPYVQVVNSSFNGKTTSTYERSHRIDLPASTTGWRVRVRRLTPDSTTSNIQSTTNISSYTEIIDAKLRYPYTAMVGITVDASQFSSIPSRAFDCKLRIVRVPSNYFPDTRTYIGTWDGTFKLAWTDNPAWIYYDLILNDRYGLGQLITAAQVDKWGLYQISGYCDEMVADGKGGIEPRFTCNLYLQTRADALQVLQDLASIFRGMAYWAAGSVVASADMPTDPVYTYTNANVIDGLFTYVGSARSTRFSVALVSWNDPSNFYEKKVEYVSDQKALARYGVQQTEISAFGCTSQGQAQRLGHYTLLTNLLENETVSFSAGLDGTIARPGQIIRIADADRAGRRIGGRIKAATARTITLDADAIVAVGDSVTVILPTGVAQTKTATGYTNRVVTVGTSWTAIPVAQSVFAIESLTLAAQTYRVLSAAENFSDTEMKYNITAVKHVAGKYAAIDNGAQIVQLPVTVIPAGVQLPPTNIRLSSFSAIDQGTAVTTMRVEWDAPANAVSYDVWWRRNSNDWVYAGRTYSAAVEVVGIYAGTYLVRVAALNSLNAASIWGYSESTLLNGKEGLPPAVTSLTATPLIFGIGLKWTFPPGAEDTQRTEIWYAPTNNFDGKTKLTDLAYPQSEYVLQSLLAGTTFFFWARLVDRTGNIGPFYPVLNGVLGQASSEAGPILELIAGQISETELGQHLLDRIDLIDGDGPGSVNERIGELQDEIGNIVDALVYVPTDPYVRDNTVRVGDNLWTAIADVPAAADGSNGPPNPAYWVNSGQSIRAANALAAQVTKNTADIATVDGKTTVTASQLQAVQASYRDDNGEGELADALKGWNSTASYAQEVKTRAEEDFAQAQRTTALDARVGTSESRITTVETTVATNQSATSTAVQQVQASVASANSAIGQNGAAIQQNSAAIQQTATAYADTAGKLSAMWSVKLQVNSNGQYVAAGIGLGIENTGAGLQSQFIVSADRFAVVNTIAGGALAVPFAVQGGQVFINQAFIQDGTITNAKIGSYISSTNYVAGQSGWILNKDGTLEINGVIPGQGRLVINSQNVSVYDVNNVLRVRLGYLG
jgi:predicted phage tail protein